MSLRGLTPGRFPHRIHLRPLLTAHKTGDTMQFRACVILAVLSILAMPAMTEGESDSSGVESAPAESPATPAASAETAEETPAESEPEERPERAAKIAVITIAGDIDYGLQKSLERRIGEAKEAGATLLIFEMDTYGGGLGPGIEIGDLLNNVKTETEGKVRTLAYIHKKAISAGAMASIACQGIVMRSGTTIGDCQAIMMSQEEGIVEAPEKIQTTVRATMRKYAQSNGYPEIICEAMVNPDLEVHKLTFPDGKTRYVTNRELDGLSSIEREDSRKELVVARGHLLTMTDKEAVKWEISSATVSDLDEVLKKYGTADHVTTRYETNWSEEMVRFLNGMAVSSILMLVGVLALYFAFKTPGLGAPEIVAVACFAVLFLSKYLVGLASVLELVIFAVGLLLLAVEIFLIPGFGVTGIAGIVCIVISLVLAGQKFILPETPFEVNDFLANMVAVFGSLIGATILFMIALRFLPTAPFLNRLVLATTQQVSEGYVVGSAGKRDMVGMTGTALSTLRPVGRAEIEGETVIVMAESEYIERGEPVVVTKVDGNRVVVTKKT